MKQKNFIRLTIAAAIILILPVTAFISPAYSDFIGLPRTGQSTSYSAGDDADILAGIAWPSPRFSNPDGSTPVNGNVVLDQLTGLYWERNGNAPGLVIYDNATSHCSGLNIDSYADFRVPNILELESLTHAGQANSAAWLNSEGFQNVQADNYWVSENYGNYVDYGWIMHLGTSETLIEQPFTDTHRVVCVRGGSNGANDPAYPANMRKTGATTSWENYDDGWFEWGVTAWDAGRFVDNLDGTITDSLTGLMWTKNGNRPSVEMGATTNVVLWTTALAFIDDMNNGTNNSGLCGADNICENFGYTDWRLPNFKELWASMTHWENETSTEDLQAYGFIDIGLGIKLSNGNPNNWCGIWTSTTDPANTNQVFSTSLTYGGNMKRSYNKDTTGLEGCGLYEGAHNPKVVWPVRTAVPACKDTLDNDGDGLTDYPDDPGCSSDSDYDESESLSDNRPPTIPILVSPIDSQSGIDTTAQFTWEESTDPDGDLVLYNLYVCEDVNFAMGCINSTVFGSYSPADISYAGMVTDWKSLLILIVPALLIGSLIKKRKTLLPVIILISLVLLSSCGNGGSSRGGGGSNVAANTSVGYSVAGLSAGTTYYWKVVADDGNGGETSSSAWTFDTQ